MLNYLVQARVKRGSVEHALDKSRVNNKKIEKNFYRLAHDIFDWSRIDKKKCLKMQKIAVCIMFLNET